MSIEPWQRVEPTVKTKIGYRDIVIKTFMVPGEDKKLVFATFLQEKYRAAGVIALTKDKKVIVARQFRHGPEKIMDEIPGGGVDPGEEPEAGARRELAEETGYQPGAIEFLGICSRDGYMNGQWFYYLATDCELLPDGPNPDDNEQVETVLMPIGEFLESAKRGNLTDPGAVLMAYDRLRELQDD